jgi:hypothetical protein
MTLPDDKVIRVLAFFVVFFSGIVLAVAWFRPDDGQTFSVFSGMLGGFGGALLMRFQPEKVPPPAGSVTTTQVSQQQTTKTPDDPKEI